MSITGQANFFYGSCPRRSRPRAETMGEFISESAQVSESGMLQDLGFRFHNRFHNKAHGTIQTIGVLF